MHTIKQEFCHPHWQWAHNKEKCDSLAQICCAANIIKHPTLKSSLDQIPWEEFSLVQSLSQHGDALFVKYWCWQVTPLPYPCVVFWMGVCDRMLSDRWVLLSYPSPVTRRISPRASTP